MVLPWFCAMVVPLMRDGLAVPDWVMVRELPALMEAE